MTNRLFLGVTSLLLAACGGAGNEPGRSALGVSVAPGPVTTTTSAPPSRTVVLVHGAFADGSSWQKVIPILQSKGLRVVAVQNPLTSLAADVDATKRVIEQQTKPVLLVGHSWGGTVITQAGNDEKVGGLVYVCAFAPDDGESTNDTTKAFGPPPWAAGLRPDSAGFLSLTPEAIARDFAQDLPASMTDLMAATQGPVQAKAFDEKVSRAAWHSKPSTYIVGTNDHIIPSELERGFAKKIGATTIELPTSHVAMLAKPNEVASAIAAAAEKMR